MRAYVIAPRTQRGLPLLITPFDITWPIPDAFDRTDDDKCVARDPN